MNVSKQHLFPMMLVVHKKKLFELFQIFENLEHSLDTRQRGYRLEKFLNHLFDYFDISMHPSFRRNAGGEQMDGAFEFDRRYFVVECKWQAKLTDIRQLEV